MNPANVISIFRILTLPLIVYLLSLQTAQASFWAIVIYGLAVFSDLLDGFIARKKKDTKLVGSFIDPLADKILVFGLLFYFAFSGHFSVTLFVVLLLRDFCSLIFRFLSSREDILFFPRKIYSLTYTFGQFLLVFALLVESLASSSSSPLLRHQSVFHFFVVFSTVIVILLAFWSLLHAFLFYHREIRKKKRLSAGEERRPLVIVANKRARGYYDSYRRRLLDLFAERRDAHIFFFPHQQNMYAGIEQTLAPYSRIVIAGGDGSFESALNHVPLNKKTLGFFPLGAGNAFYSFFYKGKRYEYLRSRFPFKEIDLDVIELEWSGGKRQTLFVNIGLDADVIRYSQDRTQHGFMDYIRGCWRSLQRAKSGYHFTVLANGKKKELLNCSTMVLGKVPYFGYGIRSLVGMVKPADGKVYGAAVVNRHASWLNKPLRTWALIVGMFNVDIPPLFSFQGKEIYISASEPFPVQAGGEFLGESMWVKLRVVRKQKVLVV